MKNVLILFLSIFIGFVGCLPQEKTTQCDSNEAYDPTERKCVATLGASNATVNITNITPATSYAISTADASRSHAVTVADPYDNGFQIRWNLTLPDGSTALLGTGLSITFAHTSYSTGTYILEVQLLSSNGTQVYDSRSWTVNVIAETVPTITAITPSPFTTTTTSAATNISATATNPDAIANVNYAWYVNGSPVTGQSGTFSVTSTPLAFAFDPSSSSTYYAGAGVYSVQLILTEDTSGAIYSSENWVINNAVPDYTNVSLATSGILSTTTPSTASIITVISGTTISAGGFLYDVDADLALDAVDFCVQVDDVLGVDGDGIFVDFLIDGTNIPAATNQQILTAGTAVCLQDFNDYSYTIPASIVAESHTITAVVYDKYTGSTNRPIYNGYTQVDSLNWTIRVRQQNTPPVIAIDSVTTGALGAITCGGQTTTSYSVCEVTHSTPFRLAITVTDDDYNPIDFTSEYAKFRVQFYRNGQLLDGTDSISPSDCYEDFGETNDATRYYCDVTLNPYDTNGPISVTGLNYTLTAMVTDEDSPYVVDPEDSNVVTWQITTVNDYNSGTAVNQFATDDANRIANPTYSYISTQATPGTAIDLDSGAVTEGDIIQFHVAVDEAERDSHTIQIERCMDAACTMVVVPALVTTTINSTDDTNPRVSSINHQVGEDEVTGTNQDDVYYRVTVTDTDLASAQTTVTLTVNNYNPDPVFASANFVPTVPSALIAFTGYPLTVDPGTITDASDTDGDTILYQWMYSTDAGGTWTPISGATERVLVWSPSAELDFSNQTGSAVELKLCLGDDGVDSTGASKDALNATDDDCGYAALDTSSVDTWDVTVYSNMSQGQSYGDNTFTNTSFGEIAVWIDPSSTDPVVKYMAYVNIGREIIIEKLVTSSTGVKSGSTEQTVEELAAISFDASTDINFATNDVTNLSMVGDSVNGALYIAYMAPIASVDQVHIRRIDISGGKTGFVHDGKFGWDNGYDDLTNNIIVTSAGINTETINAQGLAELTFTDSANNVAMTVNFNGLHGGSTDIIAGTDFCVPTSSCTDSATTASEFADAINASTASEIQGFTATVSGSVVTLEGIAEDDFVQADVGATTIGSIMVNQTTGTWQLPLIDHDLSGSNKNKISLLEGDLNVRLLDSNMAKTSLVATVPSQEVANDLDANDTIILATKEYTAGDIAVYEINTSYTIIDSDTDLFGDSGISEIKVAVSKETSEFEPSAFVTGTNSNNRLALARIDSTAGDYDVSGAIALADLDAGFTIGAGIDYYDITAGNEENQLIIAAVGDSDSNTVYEGYILQVSGSTPTIDCSYDSADAQNMAKCMKLLTAPTTTVFNLKIALSEVLEDVQIGTDGATSGESTNDIVGVGFHIDDGGGLIANDALPISGLINIKGISLTADETDAGTGYITPYVAP